MRQSVQANHLNDLFFVTCENICRSGDLQTVLSDWGNWERNVHVLSKVHFSKFYVLRITCIYTIII